MHVTANAYRGKELNDKTGAKIVVLSNNGMRTEQLLKLGINYNLTIRTTVAKQTSVTA